MNNYTKMVYALEHVAHLEDLIEGNKWESYLKRPLSQLKYEFERQMHNEEYKRKMK